MLLSFVLVLSYGVQIYLARKEDHFISNFEVKIGSGRARTDSKASSGSARGSSDGCRAEKAE
jgi:hypothetical protein